MEGVRIWDGPQGNGVIRVRVRKDDLGIVKERVRKVLSERGVEGVCVDVVRG